MDVAITIVMLVPVLLAVALIVGVIRRNVTERQAGDPVDITGAIPAVIVLMVAVLIIVAMGNAASPYVYDEDSGELTIQQNVPQLDVQPWDSYASEIKSIVIQDGVKQIGGSAFDGATGVEYISIPESVTDIGENAFGVTMKDYLDRTLASIGPGDYAGSGDGTVYKCDESIYTYSGSLISGLQQDASGAKILVLPNRTGFTEITGIAANAFYQNTNITAVYSLPGSGNTTINSHGFEDCTALETVILPDSMGTIASYGFKGCTSLTGMELPDTMRALGSFSFRGCTALASMGFNEGLTTIGGSAFRDCTVISSAMFPSTLQTIESSAFNISGVTEAYFPASITTLAADAFKNCNLIEKVTFASGFSPSDYTPFSWTFYASDGTTQIDKTVPANLAGKTFEGVYNALVEVAPGQLTLTPLQLQQVQLHTQELQQQELDIQPLPFQPTVQTQDQEPVTA